MRNRLLIFSMIIGILLISSCKKEDNSNLSSEAEILAFAILDLLADVEIVNSTSEVRVSFSPDVNEAIDLSYEFLLSEGASAESGGSTVVSGSTSSDFEEVFYFTVNAEDQKTRRTWSIIPSNGTLDLAWGLGGFQQQTLSNNRDYEWYLDQAYTGTYSGVNCGPTTTTMAARWSLESFSLTPEDARAAYRPGGGWWYTSDIDNYLDDNNINHHFISLSSSVAGTSSKLQQTIDDGDIAILCLDMYYIRGAQSQAHHIDKFYNTSAPEWGHFILVKGYKEVNNKLFFEVYDPYCYSKSYADSSPMGKDRYYRAEDLYTATSKWWNFSIVVSPDGTKHKPAWALDPSTVPLARGR